MIRAARINIERRQRTTAVLLLAVLVLLSFTGSPRAAEFSFRTDILPILTKAGCNSGACHGAATGQGGFRLSLLGYDPEEDHWNITRELSGRRINTDAPHDSLFLRKPALQLDHEGGRKLPRDSNGYLSLVAWIKGGAGYGSHALKVEQIEVDPADRLLQSTNDTFRIAVTAILSDGSRRNVTDLALYTSNDDGVVTVDKTGLIVPRSRGVTSVMVRYSGQVAAVRVAIPLGDVDVSTPAITSSSIIDAEIAAELKRLRIPSSPLSDDLEFFRRSHLDLTGRLPDVKEVRSFIASGRMDRGTVIERLLSSEDFVDFWTLKFSDLLLISGKSGPERATVSYHQWLRDQISRNVGWDKVASTLLTAEGNVAQSGPPNFYTLASDPRDIAEYAGSMFLGTQIGCARCHAHPSDRWTQDDYYAFAAAFAGVTRDGGNVTIRPNAELPHPKSKRPVMAKALGHDKPLGDGSDPRLELAAALTDDPLFGRAIVNRVWKHLFGRGLVEPIDDLRPTNPATHPVLLSKLAAEFKAHSFDLRWLIRNIVSSQTYQLTSRTVSGNRSDDRFYSHAYLKPLSAQVLVDAIAQVTGLPETFSSVPEGTRAVQLVGAQTESYALDVLGRCRREKTCESNSTGGGLAQALHLINGSTINDKLSGGVLDELHSRASSTVIEELYLRALTRFPNSDERDYWRETIESASHRKEALEDFLWTLLNSREFAFNH